MFDPTPTANAFLATLPPGVDRALARQFMEDELLLNGTHRMHFMHEAVDFLRERVVGLVYDRASAIAILGGFGVHARLAAVMAIMRTEPMERWEKCINLMHRRDDWSDRFVESGMGFLGSSVSAQLGKATLLVGPEVKLSAQEKLWFSAFDIQRI